MHSIRKFAVLLAGLTVLVGACNGPLLDIVPPSLSDINRIRDSETLSAAQKRAALTDLGLTPVVINGLLDDERLANQFGGDLRSAYEAVTEDRLDELTPDEVQIFGDAASEVASSVNYDLSDEEAQAIVDFFQGNDISSQDELIAFLDDPINVASISADIPDGALNDLFVDFDPSLLIDQLP